MILTYKKVGGLHFVRVFRFGFSFYIAKKQAKVLEQVREIR